MEKWDLFDVTMAFCILIGMIVSYLLQIWKLAQRKDSSSFSSLSLFAGMCGCVFIVFSVAIIPPWAGGSVFLSLKFTISLIKRLLPVVQSVMFLAICFLFILYAGKAERRWNIGLCAAFFGGLIANSVVLGVIYLWGDKVMEFVNSFIGAAAKQAGENSESSAPFIGGSKGKKEILVSFLNFNRFSAMACTAAQYLPQIIKVQCSKDVDSLSPWTLSIQIFGGFIYCFTYKEELMDACPYAIAMVCQILILTQYFVFRTRSGAEIQKVKV